MSKLSLCFCIFIMFSSRILLCVFIMFLSHVLSCFQFIFFYICVYSIYAWIEAQGKNHFQPFCRPKTGPKMRPKPILPVSHAKPSVFSLHSLAIFAFFSHTRLVWPSLSPVDHQPQWPFSSPSSPVASFSPHVCMAPMHQEAPRVWANLSRQVASKLHARFVRPGRHVSIHTCSIIPLAPAYPFSFPPCS